jgi:hypothetical protein
MYKLWSGYPLFLVSHNFSELFYGNVILVIYNTLHNLKLAVCNNFLVTHSELHNASGIML